MTLKERVIESAYTGMCEYIEEKLGRPVWTHELADPQVVAEIKEKTNSDFLELCE